MRLTAIYKEDLGCLRWLLTILIVFETNYQMRFTLVYGSCVSTGKEITCENISSDVISCSYNTDYLTLRNCKLPVIDDKILKSTCLLYTINIIDSKVETISEDAFIYTQKYLTTLYLDYNKLQDLEFLDSCNKLQIFSINHNRIKSLKWKNFKHLPDLTYLDVSYNNIKDIGNTSYVMRHLKEFYLNNNLIEYLKPNIFQQLTALTVLNMASNRLSYLPENLFDGLTNLYSLDLQENTFQTLDLDSFSGLSSLRNLNLSKCDLSKLSSKQITNKLDNLDVSYNNLQNILALQKLTGLYYLNISNNPIQNTNVEDYNRLSKNLQTFTIGGQNLSISSNMLSNLTKLQVFNFQNSTIFKIEENSFNKLPELNVINFENTTIENVNIKLFLKIPSLYYIGNSPDFYPNNYISVNLSNLNIKSILSDSSNVSHFRIKYLDIQRNSIESLASYSFSYINKIEILDLSNNQIRSIDENAFKYINFYKQGTEVCKNQLRLNSNRLKYIKRETFDSVYNVCWINLNNNLIEKIDPSAFKGISMHEAYFYDNPNDRRIQMESSPTQISLIGNKLTKLPNNSFAGTINMNSLLLSENKLFFIEMNAFANLPNLLILDLSNNKINHLKDNSTPYLSTLTSLKSLHLSSNQIEEVPVDGFLNLKNLTDLRLENNRLTEFPMGVFSSLKQLLSLNISNNRFTTLDATVYFPLHTLQGMDLDYNSLTSIDYISLLEHLPKLKSVSLHGNHWECKFLTAMLRKFTESRVGYHIDGKIFRGETINQDGVACYKDDEYTIPNEFTPVTKNQTGENKQMSLLTINLIKNGNSTKQNSVNLDSNSKLLENIIGELIKTREFLETQQTQVPTKYRETNSSGILSDINKNLLQLVNITEDTRTNIVKLVFNNTYYNYHKTLRNAKNYRENVTQRMYQNLNDTVGDKYLNILERSYAEHLNGSGRQQDPNTKYFLNFLKQLEAEIEEDKLSKGNLSILMKQIEEKHKDGNDDRGNYGIYILIISILILTAGVFNIYILMFRRRNIVSDLQTGNLLSEIELSKAT